MKTTIMLACAIFLGSIATKAQEKTITVETDKKPGANFTEYKTFGFSPMIDRDLDVEFFFLNDMLLRSRIREAISEELMGFGYRLERSKPDLIITFRVFEEPTTITAIEENNARFWGGLNYRNIGELKDHDVKAGTLMLSFADRRSSQVVFQGFASGLIDNDRFIKDEVKIREAVNLIIKEYDHRAKEYTKR